MSNLDRGGHPLSLFYMYRAEGVSHATFYGTNFIYLD